MNYHFLSGDTPLLISMPHSGTEVPDAIFKNFTDTGKRLPDTDWHIPLLYDFAGDLGASVLQARISRYVIDLNRPPDDKHLYPGQASTALCPTILFDGSALYRDSYKPDAEDIDQRCQTYWEPYHAKLGEELQRIKARFGYALLYDAHSIASRVPRLFDGRLPDLNLGTVHGASCSSSIQSGLNRILEQSDFSFIVNGRFIGGYITRHYGAPEDDIHAVQMEIAQDAYMDEEKGFPYNPTKASCLQPVLCALLQNLIAVTNQ